jgi:sRNA-binding carbon storage regulator CsrA
MRIFHIFIKKCIDFKKNYVKINFNTKKSVTKTEIERKFIAKKSHFLYKNDYQKTQKSNIKKQL